MKPIDFRNETFEQIQERLTDLRRAVLDAWLAHGPGTTRQVALASGIDILTFRPRTTELYQMGALALVDGSTVGHEGIYRARTMEEWEALHAQVVATWRSASGQQQLMG